MRDIGKVFGDACSMYFKARADQRDISKWDFKEHILDPLRLLYNEAHDRQLREIRERGT